MPKKSNVSAHSSGDGEDAGPVTNGFGVEDLQLPRSMIQRLAKGVLPPNTSIQKDALAAISKSATVFVNYLTSTSNEYTMRAGKKSVLARDVLEAVNELEFAEFLPRLEAELQKYISIQCDKRNSYRAGVRVRQRAAATSDPASTPADGAAAVNGTATHASASPTTAKQSPALRNGHPRAADNADGEPAAKRPRRSTLSNGEGLNGRQTNGEAGGAEDEEEISDIEDVGHEEDEGQEDVDAEEDDEGEEEEGEEDGEESGGENDGLREDLIEVNDAPDESSEEEDDEGEGEDDSD